MYVAKFITLGDDMLGNKAVKVALLISMLGFVGLTLSTQASAACNLVSTKDGSPLGIKEVDTDTPQAKEFLETCINPYTKAFANDPAAAKAGKKKFGLYSCTQCHGPNAGGQVGPSITDERWQYAKHVTDKGMFETIAGGSNGGMMTWHQQLSNPDNPSTDEILKIIGWLRSEYKGGGDKPWLK
ncbi:cytochrome c-L precursor [mine drainage metagenome]|uniref:Cytochrome c-L n=1 Tax=mine drainage metagenome TaxID=410659 RepID=A0A1J5SSF9_9ZZZZ